MVRDNYRFGGIFDKLDNISVSDYERNYVEIGFSEIWKGKNNRNNFCLYYIRIDQGGITLHISRMIPKSKTVEICEKIIPDAAKKMTILWAELEKYKFEPIGYEMRDGERYYLKSEDEAKTENIVKMDGI